MGLSAADGVTYHVNLIFDAAHSITLAVGQHTVVANFTDLTTHEMVTSNAVTLTVNKIQATLSCGVSSSGTGFATQAVWTPGQTVYVVMRSSYQDPNYPIQWSQSVVTIRLRGPDIYVYVGPPMTNSGIATITAPALVGQYELDCQIDNMADYYFPDTGYSFPNYLDTKGQMLGGVTLSTTPSALTTGVPIQVSVKFKPAPGFPIPGGQCTVYLSGGSQIIYLRKGVPINVSVASFSVSPISELYGAKSITVDYLGDPYYKPQVWTFPLTNPSGPGGGGGGGSKSTATPKPSTAGVAEATATPASPTAGADTGGGIAPVSGGGPAVLGVFGPLSGGTLIAALVVIALLAMGGGAGTFLLLSRGGGSESTMPSAAMPAAPLPDAPRSPDGPPLPWGPVDGPSGGQP
jgi:hypothetical protein